MHYGFLQVLDPTNGQVLKEIEADSVRKLPDKCNGYLTFGESDDE